MRLDDEFVPVKYSVPDFLQYFSPNICVTGGRIDVKVPRDSQRGRQHATGAAKSTGLSNSCQPRRGLVCIFCVSICAPIYYISTFCFLPSQFLPSSVLARGHSTTNRPTHSPTDPHSPTANVHTCTQARIVDLEAAATRWEAAHTDLSFQSLAQQEGHRAEREALRLEVNQVERLCMNAY
jgi:hypothetical protein